MLSQCYLADSYVVCPLAVFDNIWVGAIIIKAEVKRQDRDN